jgi:MoaA/NifB/PqqE/SkfB family radical SAM enzyme
MTIPNNQFCVLPWISVEASPIGTVRPCCLADDEIVDDSGKKFNLQTATLAEIQNSQHMLTLRQEFLQGQRPKTCRKCWNEEDAGRTSKRMHTLDRLKHIVGDQLWTEDAKPLMFLDLKLGNICNLKCRICGSWSSSSYATEELMSLPADVRKKSFAYEMLRAGAWPRSNTEFWTELEKVSMDVRYLEFTGGEPFMIQEHFDLLQSFINRGIASQIEIHYNTNGTHYPEKAVDIWQHFKTVEIAFSIDDVGSRFEYQRDGANWNTVLENLSKFKQLRSLHKNIELQVCCTVNVFNVYYLDRVADWISQQDFNFVYWNMLHDAWYFSIASLPRQAKETIKEKYKTFTIPAQYQPEFNNIISFMCNGADSDGQELIAQIEKVDKRRSQNFKKILPEMALLLDI